jgi:hypothetical protein
VRARSHRAPNQEQTSDYCLLWRIGNNMWRNCQRDLIPIGVLLLKRSKDAKRPARSCTDARLSPNRSKQVLAANRQAHVNKMIQIYFKKSVTTVGAQPPKRNTDVKRPNQSCTEARLNSDGGCGRLEDGLLKLCAV